MFKKGEYIVCINTPNKNNCSFPPNYIFKQKETNYYLVPELDAGGSSINGWKAIDYNNNNGELLVGFQCALNYFKWRFATKKEILHYNKIQKPYNTSSIINNECRWRLWELNLT